MTDTDFEIEYLEEMPEPPPRKSKFYTRLKHWVDRTPEDRHYTWAVIHRLNTSQGTLGASKIILEDLANMELDFEWELRRTKRKSRDTPGETDHLIALRRVKPADPDDDAETEPPKKVTKKAGKKPKGAKVTKKASGKAKKKKKANPQAEGDGDPTTEPDPQPDVESEADSAAEEITDEVTIDPEDFFADDDTEEDEL